ncbi:MAG TPA: excinuclease ABC subunit UvrA [Smithellaceae bacterium]|nr:excinuclease ABC subunit UvrA [Smithellaceae bacterium]HRS82994.1 excinuclease ABC subunit UvrA [Smithellaceae bacterium]HRV44602.1 excinuclease ABC subunit UvrA [Smithellaceae bacterium]
MDCIRIKGASQHNLKKISLDIPRERLVVITGVSGSGKSSLAFDTIYAEGQRRYVESLSTYARQFIGQMDKPDVESIEGLSPAIAIEQRAASHNPRSTVGTVTEIYDYFRLLFAGIGLCHCSSCGREIHSQTIDSILQSVLDLPEGERFSILSPLVRGKKGEFAKELKKLQKEGFARVRIDGEVRDLAEDIVLAKTKRHDIDLIVDRLVLKDGIRKRLRDSLEIAAHKSEGLVRIARADGRETLYSEKYACPDCGISMPPLAPRVFSFNNPYGACRECNGLGSRMHFAPDLVVPDPGLSLREGAIAPWANRSSLYYFNLLDTLARHYGFDIHTPFSKLPEKIRNVLLYGSGSESIKFHLDRPDKRYFVQRPFEGVIRQLERRWRETASTGVRSDLARYIDLRPCEACGGARLKKESLAVTVGGKNIYELCLLSIRECFDFFEGLRLTDQEERIVERVLKEIKNRLSFLLNVGMDYLNLARSTSTLSGGESQRIRLATQIGSGLMGVLYVLDEPTVGLHQRDNLRLIDTLKKLRDMGNTVLVVEHDADMMLACDHIVDMGPGAGVQGGEVIFQGSPAEVLQSETSLTGQYLSGRKCIGLPVWRKVRGRHIVLEGASENNLKDIDIRIPTGVLTAVTGVSGSGKSTMVIETLYKVMARRLNQHSGSMGRIRRVRDMGGIERVIMINQQPIGRTPRSNPVTYTGIFSFIRDLFTGLPDARVRGYKPGRFSFNVKGGRCEACEGNGLIKIEMHFLPDVYVTCDACRGKRFNADTLDIKYKDKSIADVLDLTVQQALDFFSNIASIRSHLQLLADVGLGYIRLGQPATTLSGGEAQRIKLARELGKKVNRNTLYILDEPTIGLHFADIQKLLDVLMRLVDMGNTMVVIEHNLDIIKSADHIIDLGPEGGPGGGRIIASGTVEEVARDEQSFTGAFLRKVLDGARGRPDRPRGEM